MSDLNQAANAFNSNKGVKTTHVGFDEAAKQWSRCRDVIAGSDAVKTAGPKYLPQLNTQENKDYLAYVMRANFFNATRRTVSAMVGMLFRKPPKSKFSTNVKNYLENVDMEGNDFDIFSRAVVEEIISVGRVGLFVDHPTLDNTDNSILTIAKAEEKGLRPVMKYYTAENIINWKYITFNNQTLLGMIVLVEQFSNDISEFVQQTEPRYRVLDLNPKANNTYRVRVFRINKEGQEELVSETIPLMNGKPLQYIPFIFLCTNETNADFDEPPILDLVDINLSHYRTSADYEHGCHFTGLPMVYVAGLNPIGPDGKPATIYLGSQSALILPDPNATAGYIEFTGQGLTSLENNLNRKEQMMAVLGARLLEAQKKAAETAMTSAIHRVGENSILASISIAATIGLMQALKWFSEWAGDNSNTVEYELNRDFLPVAIDGPTLTAYVQAYQAGTLTLEELFDLFQRADLIEAEVTYDEHSQQITSDTAANIAKTAAMTQATQPPLQNPTNNVGNS